MSDDIFSTSGSTEGLTSDDLLREICGDDSASAVVMEDLNTDTSEAEVSSGQSESESDSASEPGPESESAEDSAEPTEQSPVTPADSASHFDEYLAAYGGQYFIYDLETFPDESRNPRPVAGNRVRKNIDLPKFLAQNADAIGRTLKSGVFLEDQLEELQTLESEGKARSTVLGNIQQAFKNLDGDFDQWKKEGSLNPWKGRIVAMSWSFLGEEEIHTMIATNEDQERDLLATFWALQNVGIRVGYNINSFDDKWIVARSMILGVNPTCQLDNGKYSRQTVDIMWKLFSNLNEAIDCKTLASLLGITVPAEGVSGADVFSLVETRSWDLLAKYSASDVEVEKEIFRVVKRYVRV